MKEINKTLQNKDIVCALKYANNETRINYLLKNFKDNITALDEGYTITHQGRCGACSNV